MIDLFAPFPFLTLCLLQLLCLVARQAYSSYILVNSIIALCFTFNDGASAAADAVVAGRGVW